MHFEKDRGSELLVEKKKRNGLGFEAIVLSLRPYCRLPICLIVFGHFLVGSRVDK